MELLHVGKAQTYPFISVHFLNDIRLFTTVTEVFSAKFSFYVVKASYIFGEFSHSLVSLAIFNLVLV